MKDIWSRNVVGVSRVAGFVVFFLDFYNLRMGGFSRRGSRAETVLLSPAVRGMGLKNMPASKKVGDGRLLSHSLVGGAYDMYYNGI
jgi:hypothetical protein